ncbi:hypothetical protein Clacol_001111 [Clathrus columnatus]|uniref:Uncharacterized protein n=1 Tax=Clathrus columnatus TaxID=1419009 RepID=A0AAV4ZYH4_9AGAM|nr:hypothetical protein Clacol_001111 [Clathrus columnatus]
MTPNLREVLHHMSNLRRINLSWTTDLDLLREALDALIDSRYGLEEFDLSVQVLNNRRVSPNSLPDDLTEKLQELKIWSNPDLADLRKLSIRLKGGLTRQPPLEKMSYITTLFSKTQALTHLTLAIDYTSFLESLLEQTWPNLENLAIGNSQADLLPTDSSERVLILTNFFKRHRKLATLSLASNISHSQHPYITLENLPALVSFSYNPPVQVPLSKVLSIASAKKLLHLTISEEDASLIYSDMNIYKELTSLQTCCITSESFFPNSYESVNWIIENFAVHVTKFDLSVKGSDNWRVLAGFSPNAYMKKLKIWSNSNPTELRKLSIHLGRKHSVLLDEMSYITNMISKNHALTHLNLTIDASSLVRLLKNIWPNLENLVIDSTGADLLPKDSSPSLSFLTNFFKQHQKLTTLSLPSHVYRLQSHPCIITLESLPALESFSYNPPVLIPLSKVLSIDSARRLLHLTISEKDASLTGCNRDIYKELTSLQTCCITSESPFPTNYKNVNRIIENFVARVTNLERIHLPPIQGNTLEGTHFETLSLLQCLPKLTHLSGLTHHHRTHREISKELYQFYQLKYLISPSFSVGGRNPFCVFGLTRDKKKRSVIFEAISENRNPECDARTWGSFYRGTDG